jgi:asparagine synthase (glutamine-hydrolysing)
MCGFAGFVDHADRVRDPAAALAAMSAAIAHRGPDGEGTWVEPRMGIGIAHRRLAILDRTPAAAQPMRSPGGRWVLAYNGELWNHRDLRAELERAGLPVGASTGDTAVLAAMLEAHGLEATLPQLDGMFAFAALDLHERSLWLVRDRFGVKPCFWGHAEDAGGAPVFVFGSELRALAACPGFRNRVSPFAVASVLARLCTRGEETVWEGVRALLPGHLLRLDLGSGRVERRPWFRLREAALAARREGFHGDREEMARAFEGLLESAVRRRLESDVPLGAFLSGGVDSACVAAAMRHAGVDDLRTFTVGFEHPQFDERAPARVVAKALGVRHAEVLIPDAELPALAEDAVTAFDQPFADSSAIAMLAVSRAARGSVGVALSGDGGDELFGGYERHLRGFALSRWLRAVPLFARVRVAEALEMVGGDGWERALRPLEPTLPAALRRTQRGRLMHKAAAVLRARDDEALWRAFFAAWPDPASAVPQLPADMWEAAERRDAQAIPGRFPRDEDGFFDELLLRDQSIYLPDDILAKVDRASMECGLEVREPMLDLRLFRFAWRIPPRWRTDGTVGKLLLREFLRRRLPAAARAVADRPKQGFAVPMRAWLCGPLRTWADEILDPARIDRQGILEGRVVRARLDRARAGDEGAAQQAWAAICVTRWFEREGVDGSRVARVNR